MKIRIFKKEVPLVLYILILCVAIFNSCRDKEWFEHYDKHDEKVNTKLWTSIMNDSRFSSFVRLMQENELDTLIASEQSFTLFIPDNTAFESLSDTVKLIDQLLKYHISSAMINTRNIQESDRIKTLSEKFSHIEKLGSDYYYDGHLIIESSPLYLDGRYYVLSELAYPRPNLYEFTELFSPVLKSYIDSRDSISLDYSQSTALGYNDQGNTIYDSVFTVINRFERDYFPVTQEFRSKAATFVLFTQEQYNEALNEMADNLTGAFNTYEDIPKKWQNEKFIPEIIKGSLFNNMLPFEAFMEEDIKSITGDTVQVNYEIINPNSIICSNGLVYTYSYFTVPDSLYRGELRIEMEDLIDTVGNEIWEWNESVTALGYSIDISEQFVSTASGEAVGSGALPRNYDGDFSFEFKFENVFPMKYRLEFRGFYKPSGLYAVYVNDIEVGNFDTYGFRSAIFSVTGNWNIPQNGYNIKDFWVENIQEYGDVRVRFEYLGKGTANPEGFVFDYISLVPFID
jgi:hypothetical protein